MIAALGGLALQAGTSLWNAISGAKAERAKRRRLNALERANQLWYDRHYNEVGRERADALWYLSKMRDAQKARMDRAAGANIVANASSSIKQIEADAANKAIGDTVARADVAEMKNKPAIDAQHKADEKWIANARMGLDEAHQQQTANALTEASKLGAGVLSGITGSVWDADDNDYASASPTPYYNGVKPAASNVPRTYGVNDNLYGPYQKLYG